MSEVPFVSVIIPVYKGLQTLPYCLDALEKQTYPIFEIIVVDNEGNEGIETLCNKYKQVYLYHHKKPGSYSARNAGINVSKGEILVFTDADCIPDSKWLENGIKKLYAGKSRMGGGKIVPLFRKINKPTTIELCDVILHTMNHEQALNECISVACANMFVHKTLFDELGTFNDTLFSAGDCEFTFRVYSRGERILLLEDAIVYHFARRDLKEISERYRRFAGAEFRAFTTKRKDTVKSLRSLSLKYRIILCFRNIFNGIKRYRKYKNPFLLLITLIMLESYITIVKFIEYIKLSLGGKPQR